MSELSRGFQTIKSIQVLCSTKAEKGCSSHFLSEVFRNWLIFSKYIHKTRSFHWLYRGFIWFNCILDTSISFDMLFFLHRDGRLLAHCGAQAPGLHQVLVAARRNFGWSDLALGRQGGCENCELQETEQTLHDIALKLIRTDTKVTGVSVTHFNFGCICSRGL